MITLSINKGGLPLSVLRIVKAYLHNVIVLVPLPIFIIFLQCTGESPVTIGFSINLEEIHNSLSLTVCSLSRSSEQQ